MVAIAERLHAETRELVSFRVGGQDFCVDIMSVREIRGWTPATILPHAPSYVLGVINLRGSVVPIVDLAARLGLPSLDPDARHVIVICVVGNQTVGFLVDAVSDILGISPSAIQPTPDVTSSAAQTFIEGVIAVDQQMLRIIDIHQVLPQLPQQDHSQ
ncbi:chemotaxis protein CheW [Roseicitreum antarcticum]|uniref:Purine-binding chemotaxis protein CheW n=1 Tax=Roseicitreum antarcticum TaxID=564137 RepID=A0A1H3ASF9_9RHOB|nr:chemotaxis protein CheW [Roseicitreum antarcticum]SDX32535.1 purine-binding chemotaxis protein CheW [Roseicitreum antarcticum]